MAGLATWDDPVVTWDSSLYSWDGDPLFPVDVGALLRQRSVFAQVASDRLVARIDAPRLVARIIPHALI
ncbi:hypothetical protein, partial [Streptococcus pneumoniae]